MSSIEQKQKRPLSPHLQVYKPQLTSVTSILHRATGTAMTLGLLFVVWWLVAAATGPDAFEYAMDVAETNIGVFVLFGFSVAMAYHLCSGIRHLIFDTGYLFKLKNAYASGYFVFVMTALLVAYVWKDVWMAWLD